MQKTPVTVVQLCVHSCTVIYTNQPSILSLLSVCLDEEFGFEEIN